MKKSEMKAKAISIINAQYDLIKEYETYLGHDDEMTKRATAKWSAILDAFAELFDTTVPEIIHESVFSD